MAPSLKELTTKEVEKLHREKLQLSVEQIDTKLTTIDNRFNSFEKFVKRWWPFAVGVFTFITGVFVLCVYLITGYNELDKTKQAIIREQAIYRYVDSLVRKK